MTWASARQALDLAFSEATAVAPGWLAAGVVLHLLHQVVRTRGWFNIIRAAYPQAAELRARDVTLAYLAGSGLNGVVPARGGDVAKLYLIRRRAPQTRWSTLAATFLPETLFEAIVAAALLLWALRVGLLPVPGLPDLRLLDMSAAGEPRALSLIAIAAAGGSLAVAWRSAHARALQLVGRLRQGVAILNRPRDFLLGVVTWQALGRVIRLGSLAAFLIAFGLPATLATVLLVMAVQGGGRVVPTAPASAGVRIALLAFGFPALTGDTVSVAHVTAFSVGVATMLAAVGLAITVAVLGRELGTVSPRTMVSRLRDRLGDAPDARSGPESTLADRRGTRTEAGVCGRTRRSCPSDACNRLPKA